ncbi:hypothetical protein BGZ68_001796 [Mortierella alpina]|nr:hypothetical protein BGZ68_001796 [Mortierella alpina]
MVLLAAAADLLKKNQDMVFIITGDFNVDFRDALSKYVMTGSLNLARMRRKDRKKASSSTMERLKCQT